MVRVISLSSTIFYEIQADSYFILCWLMFPKIYGLLLEEEKRPAIRTSHKTRREEPGEYRFVTYPALKFR